METLFAPIVDMATREEVAFIRDARAGKASAQVALGKLYLLGGHGLKKNLKTALHWLRLAASRHEPEAWQLIGENIPYETAISAPEPLHLCEWYERAFYAGVIQAGLVWAKILLHLANYSTTHPHWCKALIALETAAESGVVEAQWILAQELRRAADPIPNRDDNPDQLSQIATSKEHAEQAAFKWTARAASNGVVQAQRLLADQAWARQDHESFLCWALPVAHDIAKHFPKSAPSPRLENSDTQLLSRCGRALLESTPHQTEAGERFLTLAASTGGKDAQFWLGSWYANMDGTGKRSRRAARRSNYLKAVYWLTRAGEQGEAKAWYMLHRICLRPGIKLPQHVTLTDYLRISAERGHPAAQLELGTRAWRKRHSEVDNDVRAVYWLQKAAFQGSIEAVALLKKIAGRATPARWAESAHEMVSSEFVNRYPLLAARLTLAALFGLSISEALMINIITADRGHCLVVDIRNQCRRSKRRLIRIETGEERAALTKISRTFLNIDSGPNGPEGSYRKRLYLFNKLFPHLRHSSKRAA